MIKVLHITAHLGGGVGKALSGLVIDTNVSEIRHTIACLEKPEKSQFIEKVETCGCEVIVAPNREQLDSLIARSDIVQLEWWNHPVTISRLCSHPLSPMRLLVWCHISGLHNPIIPKRLLLDAHKFLFTSPCSYKADNVASLLPDLSDHLATVHSCGGFDGIPLPQRNQAGGVKAGYIGSLHFAKLHPHYVDFLKAVTIPDFKVRMIGDAVNKNILERQCEKAGRKGMLEFRGYASNIASELSSINTLIYLLNPEHYGTTENALLEAMAMGIVPIVLDNPAERQIVEHLGTGLVVSTPNDLSAAIEWLNNNPAERQRIGQHASVSVRERFTVEKMVASLGSHYDALMSMQKKNIRFVEIFGNDPADWFLSCQGNPAFFVEEGKLKLEKDNFSAHGLYEQTKGTVSHFLKYFPNNQRLNQWAIRLAGTRQLH